MNSAQISFHTRRRWLWIFAALLPFAPFGFAKEHQSWKPRTIQITPHRTSENITDVVWSPDGRNIGFLTGNTVGFIDIQTGLHQSRTLNEIHKLKYAQRSDLAFAPDGKTLWFSATLNSQPVEKAPAYNYEFVLNTHEIKRHERGSLSGWFGKSVQINMEDERDYKTFLYKNIIQIKDCPSGKMLKEIPLILQAAFPLPPELPWQLGPSAYFSPDKKTVATVWHILRGSNKADFRQVDLGIYLFDCNSGQIIKQLGDGDEGRFIGHLGFSVDNEILYSLISNNKWHQSAKSPNTYIPQWNFKGFQISDAKVIVDIPLSDDKYASHFEISSTGEFVAFYAFFYQSDTTHLSPDSKTIYLWDLKTQAFLAELKVSNQITDLHFSPDEKYLAVGGKHGAITTYRLK